MTSPPTLRTSTSDDFLNQSNTSSFVSTTFDEETDEVLDTDSFVKRGTPLSSVLYIGTSPPPLNPNLNNNPNVNNNNNNNVREATDPSLGGEPTRVSFEKGPPSTSVPSTASFRRGSNPKKGTTLTLNLPPSSSNGSSLLPPTQPDTPTLIEVTLPRIPHTRASISAVYTPPPNVNALNTPPSFSPPLKRSNSTDSTSIGSLNSARSPPTTTTKPSAMKKSSRHSTHFTARPSRTRTRSNTRETLSARRRRTSSHDSSSSSSSSRNPRVASDNKLLEENTDANKDIPPPTTPTITTTPTNNNNNNNNNNNGAGTTAPQKDSKRNSVTHLVRSLSGDHRSIGVIKGSRSFSAATNTPATLNKNSSDEDNTNPNTNPNTNTINNHTSSGEKKESTTLLQRLKMKKESTRVFGVPLDHWNDVPYVVESCVSYLSKFKGLEGTFRIPSNSSRFVKVKHMFDKGLRVDFSALELKEREQIAINTAPQQATGVPSSLASSSSNTSNSTGNAALTVQNNNATFIESNVTGQGNNINCNSKENSNKWPFVAADVLKQYCRDLPVPLVAPFSKFARELPHLLKAGEEVEALQVSKQLLSELPLIYYKTLKKILGLLDGYAMAARGGRKESIKALSTVFGPNLMRNFESPLYDFQLFNEVQVINTIIEHFLVQYTCLFEEENEENGNENDKRSNGLDSSRSEFYTENNAKSTSTSNTNTNSILNKNENENENENLENENENETGTETDLSRKSPKKSAQQLRVEDAQRTNNNNNDDNNNNNHLELDEEKI